MLWPSELNRIPPLAFARKCSTVTAWNRAAYNVLIAKHYLSYCIIFTSNVNELVGSFGYFFGGLPSVLQYRAEWRLICRGIEVVMAGKERERKRGVTVVRPHCYWWQLSHRSITLLIQVSSVPVTTSHGLSQWSLNFTDQWILRKGLKAWRKSFMLSFSHHWSHGNEQAWIVIQNNDSSQRYKCCGDCIISTGYDTIFKHSSSVISALPRSFFQLKDITLTLKHIWNSHDTKTLQLRCLCMLRCKAIVTFLAMVQPNGEVTQCALCGLSG